MVGNVYTCTGVNVKITREVDIAMDLIQQFEQSFSLN